MLAGEGTDEGDLGGTFVGGEEIEDVGGDFVGAVEQREPRETDQRAEGEENAGPAFLVGRLHEGGGAKAKTRVRKENLELRESGNGGEIFSHETHEIHERRMTEDGPRNTRKTRKVQRGGN